MKRMKKNIGFFLLFLIGLSILLYPTFSNLWNEHRSEQLLSEYSEKVSQHSDRKNDQMFREAKEYNQTLIGYDVPDAFSAREGIYDEQYESLLNPAGNGIIGRIEIPSIKVNLPIYHYSYPDVLEKGAGHLFGSSLPTGGKNTHTVITAHRGLPSAKMFTDLNLLKEGDVFVIYILDKGLAYEIDSVETVDPKETESLSIQKDQDLATLITCTPYAVNSHRLLVHGHRIKLDKAEEKTSAAMAANKVKNMPMTILCAVSGIIVAVILFVVIRMIRRRRYEKEG